MLLRTVVFVSVVSLVPLVAPAQTEEGADSTGMPGDSFSMRAALEMFKQSASPEDFEHRINAQENHVNNLDLNGDGQADYIRVIDNANKNVHALVLQVPISAAESQDVAVIELEKTGDASAVIQIVGDESIFGDQRIVEPENGEADEGEPDGQPQKGPNAGLFPFEPISMTRIVVNVWTWPSVRFVYAPVYRPWISPFRWAVYPAWWRPWRPIAWRVFHPFSRRYRAAYAVAGVHRVVVAHRLYARSRVTSVTVRTRYHGAYGRYRVTKKVARVRPGRVRVRRR